MPIDARPLPFQALTILCNNIAPGNSVYKENEGHRVVQIGIVAVEPHYEDELFLPCCTCERALSLFVC